MQTMPSQQLASLFESGALCRQALIGQTQGQYLHSEGLLKQALNKMHQALGAESAHLGLVMDNLAGLYCVMKRYAEAEEFYLQAIAITEKALYPDHAQVAVLLANLVRCYLEQGKYAACETHAKRVVDINAKTLSGEHRASFDNIARLATIYRHLGKLSEAEVLLAKAIKQLNTPLGPLAEFYYELALIYEAQGKHTEAQSAYKKAIDEFSRRTKYARLAQTLNSYLNFLRTTNQLDEARAVEKQAKIVHEASYGENDDSRFLPATLLRA
ncbi:MAG: tetratricopeptide repeat protein [Candidatus Melainabacteria bacterium]|nr:tetratricopeptide repeat protein [Candidatus Melainabacteria bacterium]